MAHGVKPGQIIKLHQALHGYVEGHQQLAISITLPQLDNKTMLVLSDLSGSGSQIDKKGYLTGYPLKNSKMYALAKTWAAPEMSRPGCVWTHTLLIDFADLATLKNTDSLLALFRRPNDGVISDYNISLEIQADEYSMTLEPSAQRYERQLLAALYGYPHQRVIATRPRDIDVDPIVLAVWGQQWPRLRRAFRFTTFSTADRSSGDGIFDLQILPSRDRSVRSRFVDTIDADDASLDEPWLDEAIADLTYPSDSNLRGFLRRVGGDVSSGRVAFRVLCNLFSLIEASKTFPSAIDKAVVLLENDLGSVKARAARGMVASVAFTHSEQLNEHAFDFLIHNLDLVDNNTLSERSEKFGQEVWKRDPYQIVELLDGGDRQRAIAEKTIDTLSIKNLLKGIIHVPNLLPRFISSHPKILTLQDFWHQNLTSEDLAFSALKDYPKLHASSIAAMIAADRDDLAPRVVREFGAIDVMRYVSTAIHTNENDMHHLVKWLNEAVSNPAIVAQFLSEQKSFTWSFLSIIAKLLPVDAVPNDYGEDPWFLAAQTVNKSNPLGDHIYLSTYLLSRALGKVTRNPGELAKIGFEPIYKAVVSNRLHDEAWGILQDRLPSKYGWFDWDRCTKIRLAIADLFIQRNLAPQLFALISEDLEFFSALVKTIPSDRRSRDFLIRVRQWMQDHGPKRYVKRIQIVEKHIGPSSIR